MRENPVKIGSSINDDCTTTIGRAPKKRKSVGFANIVMVKTIGSSSMGYGPLKKVMADDVPVEEVKAGGESPLHNVPVMYGDDGRVESGLKKAQASEEVDEFGDLEDHPELTPIKGPFSSSSKAHESPDVVTDDSPTVDSIESGTIKHGGGGSRGLVELHKEKQDARVPKHKLVFSNGAEFYASANGKGVGDAEYDSQKPASQHHDGMAGYFAMVSYLLSRRQVLLSTAMYGLNGFVTIVAAEIFPIWVVTRKSDGGFGFNSQMIGLCTMISGPISIMGQLVLYPTLVDNLGLIRTYKLSCQLYAVTALLLPCVSLTNSLNAPLFTSTLVILGLSILSTTQMWVLISVFSFINNSCYSYQRATVNSIGQTFAAMGRMCGPYVGSMVFAWSETNGLSWPLDYAFTWYLVAILSIWSGSLVNQFPRSIQRRKREPKRLRYAQPGIGGGLTEHELIEEWEREEKEYEMQSLASGGDVDLESAEEEEKEDEKEKKCAIEDISKNKAENFSSSASNVRPSPVSSLSTSKLHLLLTCNCSVILC